MVRPRGGGARKSVRTPSSNIVEFKMGIKNLFSKLKSDFKEKRYDGLKKGAYPLLKLNLIIFKANSCVFYLSSFTSNSRGSCMNLFLSAKGFH